ncbi:hypothetical protein Tco_0092897 [Tanacetum coccineum]
MALCFGECSIEVLSFVPRILMENPNVYGFKKKQPSKELQEEWEQLFKGLLASGSVVMGPDAKENDFYPSLMRDVGQDILTSCPNEISRQPNMSKNVTTKPKIVDMKQKGKNSGGTKLFQEYMSKQDEKQDPVIKILESDASSATKDDPYSVSRCISVINGMVDGALMTDDIPLLYLAMDLFEDAVKRELSFGILKKRWKILGGMPKYSVETQHDIIIVVFALHNYIPNNDGEDKAFTTFEQHPDYMGCDELRDVRGSVINHDNIYSGTSNEMKQIHNDIATSIWNARRR